MKPISLFAHRRIWLFVFLTLFTPWVTVGAQTPSSESSPDLTARRPTAFFPLGGISVDDFQPIIDLIQNTVHNESWLETGQGLGTIRPFPSGVYVDADGTLEKMIIRNDLKALSPPPTVSTQPFLLKRNPEESSHLRKVSLTRLQRAAQARLLAGKLPTPAMQNLAGLTNIQYLVALPESGELILAGDGSSWRYDKIGRPVSIHNGNPTLQLDDLVVCLRNSKTNNGKFGCAITPRQENLAATQRFLAESKLSGNAWSQKLRQTLGQQDIEVFGIDDRSHAARVLVEADYHMKRIGMGLEPSLPTVPSFLDRVQVSPDGSLPPMDIVRWWFTLNYDQIIADADRQIFAFAGTGVKVLSENELLDQQGRRIHTGQTHGPAKAFAADFTQHFPELAEKYPVYRELKNLFDLALVAGLIKNQKLDRQTDTEWTFFGSPPHAVKSQKNTGTPDADSSRGRSGATYQPRQSHVAKQVDSVMNERVIRVRRPSSTLVHTLVGVSGGVRCDISEIVSPDKIQASSGDRLKKTADEFAPPENKTRWWWDQADSP